MSFADVSSCVALIRDVGVSNLSLFLQIERVDLLQLSLQPEEERRLVGLQGRMCVGRRIALADRLLRDNDRGGAQLLDELKGPVPSACTRI